MKTIENLISQRARGPCILGLTRPLLLPFHLLFWLPIRRSLLLEHSESIVSFIPFSFPSITSHHSRSFAPPSRTFLHIHPRTSLHLYPPLHRIFTPILCVSAHPSVFLSLFHRDSPHLHCPAHSTRSKFRHWLVITRSLFLRTSCCRLRMRRSNTPPNTSSADSSTPLKPRMEVSIYQWPPARSFDKL